MVKRSLQILFFFLASLLWHFNASAQIADEGFSYAQKNQTIALAKSGDAEALFLLGLSHLKGLNSVQNDALANRFFHYAAEKGHAEARTYLISLGAQEAEQDTAPEKHTKSVEAAPKPVSARAQKRRDEKAQKRRERKAKRVAKAKAKPVIIQSEVQNEEKILAAVVDRADTVSQPTLSDDTNISESNFADGEQTIKLASNSSQGTLNTHVAQPQIPASTNALTPSTGISKSFWTLIAAIVGFGVICLITLNFIKLKTALPQDFNKQAYLDLNPDVKAAGLNATRHYILHGKKERRPYKYS